MALTNKLSAIGDAIREKTGKSDLLTLDDMALEIASIETGGSGDSDTTLRNLLYFVEKIYPIPEEYNGELVVSGLTHIATRMGQFDDCNYGAMLGATRLVFPDVVVCSNYGINSNHSITELIFPKIENLGVYSEWSNSYTGTASIRSCDNLETLVLGNIKLFNSNNNLQRLGALKHLILPGDTVPVIAGGTIFDANTPNVEGIYVPQRLLAEYENATNWIQYADLLKAIEDYPEICGGVL